jgi:hypothetical protein
MMKQAGWLPLFVILVLGAGLGLRLWEPGLIEFKGDESYMFRATQGQDSLEPFPALGMPSGAGGLVNPGLSIWAFSAPARLFGIQDPPSLSRFVGLSFILTMLALLTRVFASEPLRIQRHYLIVLVPLLSLASAKAALSLFPRRGRWGLGVYVLMQLALAAQLLSYLNDNGGAPGADFGVAYKEQDP